MTVLHTGSTKQYAANWESIFSRGKSAAARQAKATTQSKPAQAKSNQKPLAQKATSIPTAKKPAAAKKPATVKKAAAVKRPATSKPGSTGQAVKRAAKAAPRVKKKAGGRPKK